MRRVIVSPVPLDFTTVTRSFAEWILLQKRSRRPSGLFMVGVNGSIGRGKTVFSQAVVDQLNQLLTPEEGTAVVRSLDDYYLPKAVRTRPEFLSRGYAPEGIPNRGPAGTHDTARLRHDIGMLEKAGHDGLAVELPAFDKQLDDRDPQPYRVQGPVGVFVLEGWFVGAKTNVDPAQVPAGLKRSVAEALKSYQPIFDRLDALWVFAPPESMDEIVTQRLEQQATLDLQSRTSGMTPAQIRRFIDYFYNQVWEPRLTSPVPPRETADFWAVTDAHHRFLEVVPRRFKRL